MKGANGLLRAKKAVIQCVMLLAGAAMVCVGAMRGEADTVLAKKRVTHSDIIYNQCRKQYDRKQQHRIF